MADASGYSTRVVDSAVEEMDRLEIQYGFPEVLLQQELAFLIRFMIRQFWWGNKDIKLLNALDNLEAVLKEARIINGRIDEVSNLVSLVPHLQEKFDQIESEIRKIGAATLDSFESRSCSFVEISHTIQCLAENLMDLANSKVEDLTVSLKNQILVDHQKLILLRALSYFSVKRCPDHQLLRELFIYVNDWVNNAASLSLLCLLKGKDETTMGRGLETVFSDLLQHKKYKLFTPEDMRLFMRVLRALKPSKSDTIEVGKIVVRIVDSLVADLVAEPLKDYVEILKDGLIFMLSFFLDPPKEDEAVPFTGHGLIRPRIDVLLEEVLSLIFSTCMDKEKVVNFSNLQVKIDKVKLDVRELYYVPFLKSLDFNFPKTNVMGHMDLFQENLKEMIIKVEFAKDHVVMVQEKLNSFKLFLQTNMELAKVRKDLKYLCEGIINLVFLAEHVISSCLVKNHPIWYDMLRLSDVTQAINLSEIKMKRHRDHQMYKTTRLMTGGEPHSNHAPSRQANPSALEEVMVDLEDESTGIIDMLTRGTKQLHFVSIVGMPGLGKTTMAQKVYKDPSIKYHFTKRAWCCVSQVYSCRELYFDILSEVAEVNARKHYSKCTDDDLAQELWRKLKHQRYLIVLDDIWNIEAWEGIKNSFPDDMRGSRILLTSRIQDLVTPKMINCSVHFLRSLSDEESWELMKGKLSCIHSSDLDDELSVIANNIAKNCKGLPLSVILVAGILAGKGKEFWRLIECRSSSQVIAEDCKAILELSYKHLPDYLKPCFLYFGTFPEDTVVRAKKLMSLWIAEGLIPRNGSNKISLYEVAENYLQDLISRSLVMLAERSTNGGIKTCRVHDLIHDLCWLKTREDNFLQWVYDKDVSSCSSSNPNQYKSSYRLCIRAEWSKFIETKLIGPFVTSVVVPDSGKISKPKPIGLISHSLVIVRKECTVQSPSSFFNSFMLLHVLDMECIEMGDPFPEELTLMVHLRYLAIFCKGTKLPPSIANLWNLEVLIFANPHTEFSLPKSFWGMKSLRYIHAFHLNLPYEVEDHEYGQLEKLEILTTPFFKWGNETNKLLRRLPGLWKLRCEISFVSDRHYEFPEMSHLNHLLSLNMHVCGMDPHWWQWNRTPALAFPSSLRKLTLSELALPWSGISAVGELPSLEVLKLRLNAFSGSEWVVEDGQFMNLKYLELSVIFLEELIVQNGSFPRLEELILGACSNLIEIPSELGYIPTLKKIAVYYSDQLSDSAEEILKEQRDFGNDILEVLVIPTWGPGEEEKIQEMLQNSWLEEEDRHFSSSTEFSEQTSG
ncbi:OLC1v1008704C1 [Oldenlandia corymbosa var. corymbosa]|uniref:OLC1v1008704C1 n=1 Tax=Oldenlandia corymbosa var. corymbosa TaxID=529605 RepID=A0AAV1DMC7_OLDCO|nr:OLC1v1008704C1 [Oldenlandia corymbosa var. corymbosa]